MHAYNVMLRAHVFGTLGCSKNGMGARYVNWMTSICPPMMCMLLVEPVIYS